MAVQYIETKAGDEGGMKYLNRLPRRVVTIYLPLADFIDVAAECERLGKERQKLAEQITRQQAQLSNENFVSRARPDVVEKARTQLASLLASQQQIDERIAGLCGGG